jgi:hypothetical protein
MADQRAYRRGHLKPRHVSPSQGLRQDLAPHLGARTATPRLISRISGPKVLHGANRAAIQLPRSSAGVRYPDAYNSGHSDAASRFKSFSEALSERYTSTNLHAGTSACGSLAAVPTHPSIILRKNPTLGSSGVPTSMALSRCRLYSSHDVSGASAQE